MLELSAVHYKYPGADSAALQNISLSLQAGDIVGVLGPNGAGKTTLFSLLSGLTQPSQGQLRWQHNAIQVGLVPQHLAFYGQLSIAENLAFFADIYQLTGALRQRQIQLVIAACDLGSRLTQRAATLSGGWQRRLSRAGGHANRGRVQDLLSRPQIRPGRQRCDRSRAQVTTGCRPCRESRAQPYVE